MKHPRTAALTGGIASGKSTVAAMFQDLGAVIIDADIVARQVVEPEQPAWHEIVNVFGKAILLKNGRLDRRRLGALVFRSAEKRRVLEQIIHPRVIAEIDRQEASFRKTAPETIILVDAPLLIEANMHTDYATILVVYVPENIQMQRLMTRDGLSEAEARERITAQMPLAEKCAYATHVIENDGTMEHTREQVMTMYHTLLDL